MAAPPRRSHGPAGGTAGLTPAQREAVDATDQVLCVLAGAGAGKTRVLTLRVARRVRDGSAVRGRVLVTTFSRKAADELARRLWSLGVGTAVEAGTFHRTALRLVRQHRSDHGRPAPVLLGDRRAALAALLQREGTTAGRRTGGGGRRAPAPAAGQGTGTRPRRDPSAAQLEVEIGWAKARLVSPEAYEDAARRAGRRPPMGAARVAELYGRYEAGKRRQGAMDLDDLLWDCADLLEADARFAAAVRWRYRHLFVDEMQDVNPAQYRLLGALLGPEPDLFVVGDPHQSVYGWNGADPTLLDRLPQALPGTRVLRLDENHRCSPQVVAVAAAALGLEAGAAPTSVRREGAVPRIVEHPTDLHEAAWVAREAWRAHRPGRRWSQVAVLARTNAQLRVVAGALAAERVPHRFAGSDLAPGAGTAAGTATTATADGGGEAGDPDDAVVLSTFHRAKGLQWPTVFVVGLSDGLVPIASARTPAALDEERRLLYVALTRAEDELTCTWATHGDHDEHEPGAPPRRPSPWLAPMGEARAALAARDAPPDPGAVRARIDELRARIDAGDSRPPG